MQYTDLLNTILCVRWSSTGNSAAIVYSAMNDKQQLGKRIKRLRANRGLTQDALSEKVEINPKYLSNIERGKENPTLDTLLRLAHALKVEPWEMFMVEEDILDKKALREKLNRLLDQAKGEEQLRLIVRLLRAAIH